MKFVDYMIVAVTVMIVSLAVWYVYQAKKNGRKCIGCPNGGHCKGDCQDCGK